MAYVFNTIYGTYLGDPANIYVIGFSETDTVTMTNSDGTISSGIWKSVPSASDPSVMVDAFAFSAYEYGDIIIDATDGTCTFQRTLSITELTDYYVTGNYYTYLYKEGDECTATTGGWTSGYRFNTHSYYSSTGTFQKQESCLYELSGTTRCNVGSSTVNKIDITDYNTLNINVLTYYKTCSANTGSSLVGLYSAQSGSDMGAAAYIAITTTGNFSVDISSLSGTYYVIFNTTVSAATSGDAGYMGVTLDSIWLN